MEDICLWELPIGWSYSFTSTNTELFKTFILLGPWPFSFFSLVACMRLLLVVLWPPSVHDWPPISWFASLSPCSNEFELTSLVRTSPLSLGSKLMSPLLICESACFESSTDRMVWLGLRCNSSANPWLDRQEIGRLLAPNPRFFGTKPSRNCLRTFRIEHHDSNNNGNL